MSQISLCKRCWKRNGIAKPQKASVVEEKDCKLCYGVFTRIPVLGKKISDVLDKIPGTQSFLIGTRMPKDSERYEEDVWDIVDLTKADSVKGELNRELGKWVEKNTRYRFDPNPDVRATIDAISGNIESQVTSTYLYGRYQKLKRNVRQTKRIDSTDESVEAFIEKPLLAITKAQKAVLHGAGREDIDVIMIGDGRPFVIEIVKPQVRTFDIKKAQAAINKSAKGFVKVDAFKTCSKELVEIIKRAKFDKTYEAIVELDKPITKEDLSKLPSSALLAQRTPTRVANRRADLIRKRAIKHMDIEFIDKTHFNIVMTTQSGTYVKEFINGDNGRTQPSMSSMLQRNATCTQLTVKRIHGEWLEDFW